MREAVVALVIAAATLGAAPTSAAGAVIDGARIERRGAVLELHFAYRGRPHLRLSRHGNQLWIDCARTRLVIPPRPLLGYESAPLSLLRAIPRGRQGARLLLEVSQPSDYAMARLPDEILVRLAPAGAVPDLAAPLLVRRRAGAGARASAASLASRARFTPPAANRRGREPQPAAVHAPPILETASARVVIDPGHGGHDPGALSADRVAEKDLALQISRQLFDALSRRGVSVTLTRDSDRFLALAERTRLANRQRADLFLSIHLNSSPNPATSGIETYYLNNTTDRATIRLARMENAAPDGYGAPATPNLNYILSDLRQQYKANESAALARMIDAQAVAELQGDFAGVNGLGAKKGPFYVLVGAHMPAVLVECGFLSNRAEARRLSSPRYQAGLAEAIAEAVVHYLNVDLAVGNL